MTAFKDLAILTVISLALTPCAAERQATTQTTTFDQDVEVTQDGTNKDLWHIDCGRDFKNTTITTISVIFDTRALNRNIKLCGEGKKEWCKDTIMFVGVATNELFASAGNSASKSTAAGTTDEGEQFLYRTDSTNFDEAKSAILTGKFDILVAPSDGDTAYRTQFTPTCHVTVVYY